MDPAEGSCCTLSVSLRDLQAPHIPMDRLRCAFCLGVFRDLEAISLAQKTLQKDARRAKGLSCEAGDQTAYSDFDTYDKNNRYRLMDMSARDCNRDGAALRFVAEKLSKQTSEVKILMIICDGQPNDDGYSGSAAEADLRGIKLEYARKGVKIYAAAIGEDRPRIERIYGDGYLDITNLQELPVMLTNLIVHSLPR